MVRKENTSGGGAQTTVNGLRFENNTSLKQAVKKQKNLVLKNDIDVYKGEKLIGKIFEARGSKNKPFYDFLKSEFGVDGEKELNKTINPDKIFYNIKQKRFYVIECKYQERAGSVDEKLQTFPYKRSILNYLLFINKKSKDVDLEYSYVLNKKWFGQINPKTSKEKYHEMFKYIKENGSNYYFDVIPLYKLGIY